MLVMGHLDHNSIDKIVQQCFESYNKLPKTGKPVEKEWTILSCIVQYNSSSQDIKVVSLGTGSKCIGATKMSPEGDMLNDSHAEVFARRGFLLYLYDNIEKAINNDPSIFFYENRKFKIKENIEFIFYSSQLPCGDASIIPKTSKKDFIGDLLQNNKRKHDDNNTEAKKPKLDVDIHRTGAKCLPDSEQDLKQPGFDYHVLGQVRTKPGRGDRTLSVSCSDKIARWIHLGIHGALLDMLCEPILINQFIFGAGVPYSLETLQRALLNRNLKCSLALDVRPGFHQSTLKFVHARTENDRPAPGSIVWVNVKHGISEVSVRGKKLGATKKKANTHNLSLCISKYNLYQRFLTILSKNKDVKQNIIGEDNIENISYNTMKRKSNRYNKQWLVVKETFFKTWTLKPDMWNFRVNSIY